MTAQSNFNEIFLEKWENVESYTLACADLMPADKYDFKPTPEMMSFKEQLIHMMENMMWLTKDYIEGPGYTENLRDLNPGKNELIDIIKTCFVLSKQGISELQNHKLNDKVNFFAGEKTILQILILMNDHMTHHRGQLIVYLRLNNIKPPRYIGW